MDVDRCRHAGSSEVVDKRRRGQIGVGILMDQWARLRSDWARWAAAQVATWPDGDGPRDHGAIRTMLAAVLAGRDAGLPFT